MARDNDDRPLVHALLQLSTTYVLCMDIENFTGNPFPFHATDSK